MISFPRPQHTSPASFHSPLHTLGDGRTTDVWNVPSVRTMAAPRERDQEVTADCKDQHRCSRSHSLPAVLSQPVLPSQKPLPAISLLRRENPINCTTSCSEFQLEVNLGFGELFEKPAPRATDRAEKAAFQERAHTWVSRFTGTRKRVASYAAGSDRQVVPERLSRG